MDRSDDKEPIIYFGTSSGVYKQQGQRLLAKIKSTESGEVIHIDDGIYDVSKDRQDDGDDEDVDV